MSSIVASYLVRVTVREPGPDYVTYEGAPERRVPTNDEVADAVAKAVEDLAAQPTTATSERLDE